MRIRSIEISGYRSLRDIQLELAGVTMFVGPNGCGKSNVYQAVQLLASAANGQFARRIAVEGGIRSVLWAGHRSVDELERARLSITFDELNYELEFGRIAANMRMMDHHDPLHPEDDDFGLNLFKDDPDIKSERVQLLAGKKKIEMLSRKGQSIQAKNMEGRTVNYPADLHSSESVLSELREPQKFPELATLRSLFMDWRFYHDFRTDLHSPIRDNQLATITPILNHDGRDLAAAIATIRSISDRDAFDKHVENAFPGSSIEIDLDEGSLSLNMLVPGLYRRLGARELSDGTLQYLCLLAALLTPRPCSFMVFNEPETSIHADLYEPLADLILAASKNTQILMTTHSNDLANFIQKKGSCKIVELEKVDGATRVRGATTVNRDAEDDDDEAAAVRAFRNASAKRPGKKSSNDDDDETEEGD